MNNRKYCFQKDTKSRNKRNEKNKSELDCSNNVYCKPWKSPTKNHLVISNIIILLAIIVCGMFASPRKRCFGAEYADRMELCVKERQDDRQEDRKEDKQEETREGSGSTEKNKKIEKEAFKTEKILLQLRQEGITRQDAARILYRFLEEQKEAIDETLVANIEEYHRISDIEKVDKDANRAVCVMFSKGIMVGQGKKYSHQRKFFPNRLVKENEAKLWVYRLLQPDKRVQISWDGQVIRTTNLPKYKQYYSYILEAFPNEYYDRPFSMYYNMYWDPKTHLDMYFYPCELMKMEFKNWYSSYPMEEVFQKYAWEWTEKACQNLSLRLNFDYRTSGRRWMNELLCTYANPINNRMIKQRRKSLQAYMQEARKNHVVIKAVVSADPSGIYYNGGYQVRVYVRFCVLQSDAEAKQDGHVEHIIFGEDGARIKDFQSEIWYEKYYDISIGASDFDSMGEGFGVSNDLINDWFRETI